MRDRDYATALSFLADLFEHAEQAIELRACPNEKGAPGALSVFTLDDEARRSFCKRKDEMGFGVYFGAATRLANAKTGGLESVAEVVALWVDIDCAKQGLEGKLVLDTLAGLPFPPTHVINSGGGIHAWWKLEEPVAPTSDVGACLRRLALILAGDMQCAELARIMRLPGTMNTKPATLALYGGEPFVCEVIEESGRVYSFGHVAEWLESQRPLLKGMAPQTARPLADPADPFLAYAREAGYNPAIDIDAELAAMRHGATGDNSIHGTQIRVTYSMIARGYDDEEIVNRILAATEAAAPRDEQWNWAREEKSIRRDIARSRSKQAATPRLTPALQTQGNTVLKLVPPEPVAQSDPKQSKNEITVLGGATLAAWRDRYGPIMHSQGTSYTYEGGVWALWDQSHDQMLRALLQEGCTRLRMKPGTSLLNAATRFVMDNPDLLVRQLEFDKLPLVIAEDGVLDLETMEIKEHSPDHFAKFKVGAKLQGSRECHAFKAFLIECFSDRESEEARAIVATLQEWFGACLVWSKPRALRKGLLIHGGSRTSKTQVSEILRALLGRGQTTAIKMRELEKDPFGTETFLNKRGWIADDAVGQGDNLDAETYKVLVTGEAMSVRRKNRLNIEGFRFACPVCWTMNSLPKIRDGSDAVYNRSLVLPMTRVRPESAPEPVGYDSISEKIIAEELTGVLWWAMEGWHRLRERGVFNPPSCMVEAIRALQESNDPIGTWLRQCAVDDPQYMVAPADLFASFAGWFFQEKGDTKFNWSQNGFSRDIKAKMPKLKPYRTGRDRWTAGIRLTDEGLECWSMNAARDEYKRAAAKSTDIYVVNQQAPDLDEPQKGRTRF